MTVRLFLYFHLVCLVLAGVVCASETPPVASHYYSIDLGDGTKAPLPFERSQSLSVKDPKIVRLIFTVHSSNYDASLNFGNARKMTKKAKPARSRDTLIVAPQFLRTDKIKGGAENCKFLHWKDHPYWGSFGARYQGKDVRFSAYEAIDQMLEAICNSGNFPNLKTVVIMGHSAGGQLTNRYSVCGLFESNVAAARGIEVRYIVMAPSSYVYFDGQRPSQNRREKFAIPQDPPRKYDSWGYGLRKPLKYCRDYNLTSQQLRQHYPRKKVLFLVGSKDKNPKDRSLDKSASANLQGPQRVERAKNYYNYLKHYFGNQIARNQTFRVIQGAPHSSTSLMLSKPAIDFTFATKTR